MKSVAAALFLFGYCLCCPAEAYRLDGLEGVSFRPHTNAVVVWAATNELPGELWIYKVVPQEFSMAVVSNVMALCEFQWNNLRKPIDPDIEDKKLITFTDKKQQWTRYLEIAPTLGWIEYNAGQDPKTSSNGVPSKAEMETLARNALFQLGIDRSLVCDKHNVFETEQGKLSRDGRRLTTNIVARGISLTRLIDGIEPRNVVSFRMIVEGNMRLTQLILNWRHLSPHEPHLVSTPNEIVHSVRSGYAKLPPQPADLSGMDSAVKLRITDVMLRYFDGKGSKSLEFSYPFAALKVLGSFEGTNTTTFFLECPILSTNVFRGRVRP